MKTAVKVTLGLVGIGGLMYASAIFGSYCGIIEIGKVIKGIYPISAGQIQKAAEQELSITDKKSPEYNVLNTISYILK